MQRRILRGNDIDAKLPEAEKQSHPDVSLPAPCLNSSPSKEKRAADG